MVTSWIQCHCAFAHIIGEASHGLGMELKLEIMDDIEHG